MPFGDSGAPFMNPLADQQTETCINAANPFDTMSKARRHKGLSEIEEIPRTDFDPCKHIASAQFQWDRVSGSHVAPVMPQSKTYETKY